jgi:hypothetical protein
MAYRSRKGELVSLWLLAQKGNSVEAAGGYGAKFFAFWVIVLLIVAVIIGTAVLFARSRRQASK